MKLNIIGNKKWFLLLSGILVALSIASIVFFGFNIGIDFKSGSMWQIMIPNVDERIVREFAENNLSLNAPIISYDANTNSYILIIEEISPIRHAEINTILTNRFPDSRELDFATTAPSVSQELQNRAIWIIVLVVILITLYITFTFRKVSWPVQSYKYGLVALIALMHDVLIATGFFAILSHYRGATVDTYLIVALLTVAGFSVQDTIVIFDRIREKLLKQKSKEEFSEIANKSVNEVFIRSVNTAIGSMIVLLIVAIYGPLAMRYFALTMLVGMFFGTYSSIFVASPILTIWHNFDKKKSLSAHSKQKA